MEHVRLSTIRVIVWPTAVLTGCRQPSKSDALITSDVQPSSIPQHITACTEGVCDDIHRSGSIVFNIVFSCPSWVAFDLCWVILYLVDNVNSVCCTEEDLERQ